MQNTSKRNIRIALSRREVWPVNRLGLAEVKHKYLMIYLFIHFKHFLPFPREGESGVPIECGSSSTGLRFGVVIKNSRLQYGELGLIPHSSTCLFYLVYSPPILQRAWWGTTAYNKHYNLNIKT